MSNKNINDIIIFMINNNLDYKNYDLLSNLNIFINKDYISNKKLINLVKIFENNLNYSNLNDINDRQLADILRELRERASSIVSIRTDEEEEDEYFNDEEYEEEEDEEVVENLDTVF